MSITELPTYNGWPNYPTWNVALWRHIAGHLVDEVTES
jgi:hypothetical protein